MKGGEMVFRTTHQPGPAQQRPCTVQTYLQPAAQGQGTLAILRSEAPRKGCQNPGTVFYGLFHDVKLSWGCPAGNGSHWVISFRPQFGKPENSNSLGHARTRASLADCRVWMNHQHPAPHVEGSKQRLGWCSGHVVPGPSATTLLCLKQSADIRPDWLPLPTEVRMKPCPHLFVQP